MASFNKITLAISVIFYLLYFSVITYAFSTNKDIVEAWTNMFDNNKLTLFSWSTLMAYRFLIYFLPPIIFSFFKSEAGKKILQRYIYWQNNLFISYLIIFLFIQIFGFNYAENFYLRTAFSNLSFFISSVGLILTLILGKKMDVGVPFIDLAKSPITDPKSK